MIGGEVLYHTPTYSVQYRYRTGMSWTGPYRTGGHAPPMASDPSTLALPSSA
jgi:hypothetical protein